MVFPLAQIGDIDGWLKWLLIAAALMPVGVLTLIILGGVFGWVRDPRKVWTKQK